MAEQLVSFQFKARYFTIGELNDKTKGIVFALHGYGQLSNYFIRKFKALEGSGFYVIAPEGLSKFYLEDVTSRARTGNNRVGATWMTKETRLLDIENYLNYLTAIYKQLIPPTFNGKVSIFGFSQGAATATRWAIDGKVNFNHLILWSGVLPPDIDFNQGKEILKQKHLIEVIGSNDPFITDERLYEMTDLSNRLEVKPEIIKFDGGHEINDATLIEVFNSLYP